jgi:hypothetical protein
MWTAVMDSIAVHTFPESIQAAFMPGRSIDQSWLGRAFLLCMDITTNGG